MPDKLIVPCGEAVRGCVRGIVRALDSDTLTVSGRSSTVDDLFKSHVHFGDDDVLAIFSVNYLTCGQETTIMRAYLERGGRVDIALMCSPESVSQVQIDASGMSDAEVLQAIAKGDGKRHGLSSYWLSGLNVKLRRHLLCFAEEFTIDRQGHADLVPALMCAGYALDTASRIEGDKMRIKDETLRCELEAMRAQLAWAMEGMKVVHFGSSQAVAPRVPVYAELLANFAPGYFKTILNVTELPAGSSIEGPVGMHVRAQQAFAYAVAVGKLGIDDEITIHDGALDGTSLTFWECENCAHTGGCVVSPLYLDFATAAQLAAFCRAITSKTSERSHDLYIHVGKAYLASMDMFKPDHLETWCAHVWPLDDMTIDMYEACAANDEDAFCFSDTFDEDKQNARRPSRRRSARFRARDRYNGKT
jgi:hypothetical protein